MKLFLYILSSFGFIALLLLGQAETSVECDAFFWVLGTILGLNIGCIGCLGLYKIRGGNVAFITIVSLVLGTLFMIGNFTVVCLPKTQEWALLIGFIAFACLLFFYQAKEKRNYWLIFALLLVVTFRLLKLGQLYCLLPEMPIATSLLSISIIIVLVVYLLTRRK